jgi:hypothetical protein
MFGAEDEVIQGGGALMRERHCCATCRHIAAVRTEGGKVLFRCTRLGYETHTDWRFNCWDERPPGTPMRKEAAPQIRRD